MSATHHFTLTAYHPHLVGQFQHNTLRRLGAYTLDALHLLDILSLYGVAQLVHSKRREHHPRGLVADATDAHQQAEHLALGHIVEAEELLRILTHHKVGV